MPRTSTPSGSSFGSCLKIVAPVGSLIARTLLRWSPTTRALIRSSRESEEIEITALTLPHVGRLTIDNVVLAIILIPIIAALFAMSPKKEPSWPKITRI